MAAVMCLVIEEVAERRGQPLRHAPHVGCGGVGDASFQRRLLQTFDPVDDPPVLRLAQQPEGGQGRVENGVEPRRGIAFTGEATHPDAVGDQDVIERAHHGFEEGADIPAVFLPGQFGGSVVNARIGPFVIGRHHQEMLFHGSSLYPVVRRLCTAP